jgi:hypothetical protein
MKTPKPFTSDQIQNLIIGHDLCVLMKRQKKKCIFEISVSSKLLPFAYFKQIKSFKDEFTFHLIP